VRGPDGRPRSERFANAAAYRARLATLQFTDSSLSIDEIVGALDVTVLLSRWPNATPGAPLSVTRSSR